MSEPTLLAIDMGTQSARALLFDLQGNLLAKGQQKIEPYYSPAPGWAEQDPEVFWQAICSACQKLWQQPGVNKASIRGVGLTTQRATVINLDRDLRPLRPAIVWMDQRRTPGLKPIGGLWGLAFRLSGMTATVNYLQAEAEASWIRTHQPEIWAQTHKYVLLSGYLTYRLVGELVDSTGCQVGYLPFDYKKQDWAAAWDWKWQVVPLPREALPPLRRPGEVLGYITPTAAEATGIPAGLPLIATAADKACEVLGSGCLLPDLACLSYGTTATINVTSQRYLEVTPLLPPYPSAVPGAYSLEVQVYRDYWMVTWFRGQFGQPEEALAREQGQEPETLFDRLVNAVPPGADGLILQPYWSPGLKEPGPEARGAVIGFRDLHTRAHLYRAILEGVAYALREGGERIVRRTRVPIRELRVAGGGSQSEAAMQLTADIFGLPASRPHIYEASGLGAAIVVAVGLGLHRDFESAAQAMTRPGKRFEPIPEHHRRYNALYHRIYRRLYHRLRPLYAEMEEMEKAGNE